MMNREVMTKYFTAMDQTITDLDLHDKNVSGIVMRNGFSLSILLFLLVSGRVPVLCQAEFPIPGRVSLFFVR
jgi:hypothetical protein